MTVIFRKYFGALSVGLVSLLSSCFEPMSYPSRADGSAGGVATDDDENVGDNHDECGLGYECIEPPPSGWTRVEHVEIVQYPATDGSEPCLDGSPPVKYYAGPEGPMTCTDCLCTWWGASCTAPEITCYYGNKTCEGDETEVYQGDGNVCAEEQPSSQSLYYGSCKQTAPAMRQSEGECETSGGEKGTDWRAWEDQIRVCDSQLGKQCGESKFCVQRAPEGLKCMRKDGDAPCPSGYYTRIDAFTTIDDQRKCGGCTCDTSTIGCNGGGYTVYRDDHCMNGPKEINDECVDVTGQISGIEFSVRPKAGEPTEGTCKSGEPVGAVKRTGEITICCID